MRAKAQRRTRAAAGLCGVRGAHGRRKKECLTGGAHVAEKEGGGEWGASWAGEGELGRRWDFWAAGKEEKGRGRKERWAGWAEKRKG